MDCYGDELMRTACLLIKDRQLAEEAVQDTFIQAYSSITQLRDRGKLRSWLLRIVVNRCRMRMRQWSFRNLLFFGQMEPLLGSGRAEDQPEEHLVLNWERARLSEAISRLDYKQREAVVFYYYHGMSIQELSELLSLNPNTVKARLARGRLKLKSILEEEELA